MQKGRGLSDDTAAKHFREQQKRLDLMIKYRREGMTHKDIASVIGCTISMVRAAFAKPYLAKFGRAHLIPELTEISRKMMSRGLSASRKSAYGDATKAFKKRYDELAKLRLGGMRYDEISEQTGYSLSVIQHMFTTKTLERIGKDHMVPAFRDIANQHHTEALKDRGSERTHRGELIKKAIGDGITPCEFVAAHPEWSAKDTRRVFAHVAYKLYDDGTIKDDVDKMIRDGYSDKDISRRCGLTEGRLRKIRKDLYKLEGVGRMSYCCQCGAHLEVVELTTFRGRTLCRECLYPGGADAPVDMRDTIALMANRQRD
jgi:uncharacterized protein YerC